MPNARNNKIVRIALTPPCFGIAEANPAAQAIL
jgi:hypothetical protein